MKNNLNNSSLALSVVREPTDEEIKAQEKFVSLKAWNNFRCPHCRKTSDMLKCKSLHGSIICPKCGHLS